MLTLHGASSMLLQVDEPAIVYVAVTGVCSFDWNSKVTCGLHWSKSEKLHLKKMKLGGQKSYLLFCSEFFRGHCRSVKVHTLSQVRYMGWNLIHISYNQWVTHTALSVFQWSLTFILCRIETSTLCGNLEIATTDIRWSNIITQWLKFWH